MQLSTGTIEGAQKIVVYGPEGIGKSTFASKFPKPIFIDTEGGTKHLNVTRTPNPSSWSMLLEQIRYFKNNPGFDGTLVIDTADWAEQLCIESICEKSQKESIEDFGYGKGYVMLAEEYGRFLNLLSDLIEQGVNVVITAHAALRKFEQPHELGAYDRWELKLQKKTAPLLKEWADMVLFANYKTIVVNVDNQGAQKGKNKAQGGTRVMYASHHPCWDAKNRHGLPDELPFDYSCIEHCITHTEANKPAIPHDHTQKPAKHEEDEIAPQDSESIPNNTSAQPPDTDYQSAPPIPNSGIPKALYDLMVENEVVENEIQNVVANRGYYPRDTVISNYSPDFVSGVLVAAWPQVFQMIKDMRELPFK